MAAALGTIRFALPGGRVKAINFYANDTTNNLVRFDESKVAVAGSNDKIIMSNGGTLVDICFTTDLATPTNLLLMVNGQPTGDVLDVTAHLASVVARPNPTLGIPTNGQFQAMQIA